MLNQDEQSIDLVRDIILSRVIHKANNEFNILKGICKLAKVSRSEAKEFLDCYIGQHWIVQKDDDGVDMYTLKPFSNLGGL